jgi:hypothetical protein
MTFKMRSLWQKFYDSRLAAIIRQDLYMPIFHPRLWLAHRKACKELLEMIGFIDLDL